MDERNRVALSVRDAKVARVAARTLERQPDWGRAPHINLSPPFGCVLLRDKSVDRNVREAWVSTVRKAIGESDLLGLGDDVDRVSRHCAQLC